MFDVGLSEILIIAIIALVVLGPERLPKAARLAGFWVRKARAQWYTVKAELESEMADEELKSSLKASMADLQQTLNAHQESLQQDMQTLDSDLQQTLNRQKDELQHEMRALDTDPKNPIETKDDSGTESAPDSESTPRP
ncbi:MAG: Sec-independent protein translocase protein TatB [Arenimonas sp.]